MAFYEIKWAKFGTALIQADTEEQAFEYLDYEIDYDEAEVENLSDEQPKNLSLYDPVSIEK